MADHRYGRFRAVWQKHTYGNKRTSRFQYFYRQFRRMSQGHVHATRHRNPFRLGEEAITIMTGPEGGFSPEEEELAIQNGVIPLSMGSRILRTETAGMAAISAINAIWDNGN